MSSRVPESWGKPPNFFFGNRESFKGMALDDAFPRWLRVTFSAYWHFGANGHAVFRQKALTWILGDPDADGVMIPVPRQRVREAIDDAIDRRLLEPESKALCLVVPPAVVAFGVGKEMPCPRHPAKRNEGSVSFDLETTRIEQVVSTPHERRNRVVSGSGPLFSLPTHLDHERPAS